MRHTLIRTGAQFTLKSAALSVPVLIGAIGFLGLVTGLSSCASNEEFQARMDRQTERQASRQERRSMRARAEDERYERWYDRIMQ